MHDILTTPVPAVPVSPAVPTIPPVPTVPAVPSEPAVPVMPAVPTVPPMPAVPGRIVSLPWPPAPTPVEFPLPPVPGPELPLPPVPCPLSPAEPVVPAVPVPPPPGFTQPEAMAAATSPEKVRTPRSLRGTKASRELGRMLGFSLSGASSTDPLFRSGGDSKPDKVGNYTEMAGQGQSLCGHPGRAS